jgi:2-iminobutanoate/2-iminopropanoate deaminase
MKYFLVAMTLIHIATLGYAAPLAYCSGGQSGTTMEDRLLQQLIPNFAKDMSCEMDASHCVTKWNIQENSAKFSVAWKKQCGPIIDGTYQLGDAGRGSTFVCEKQMGGKTCCSPLGYDRVSEWVVCGDEPTKTVIAEQKADQPAKNFSAFIAAGDYVFLSGTIGTGSDKQAIKGIRAQTEQVMERLKSTLAESGLTMSDVVKASVFIRNPKDFEAMNEVYRRYFPANPPARTTVVTRFPNADVLVEIEVIAYRGK